MSFITSSDVLQDISDALKQSGPAALPTWWTNVATQALQQSYYDILGLLLARGFNQAQVDAWDRGAEYQHDLALMYALKRGASVESIDENLLTLLDRREELKTVQVFAAGVWVRPADSQQQGIVTSGTLASSNDIFATPVGGESPDLATTTWEQNVKT